jgi:hypothetical protein
LDDPPPRKFIHIGSLNPTKADLKVKSSSLSGWSYLTEQARLQTDWQHDPESVLAEAAASQRQEVDQRLAEQLELRKTWKKLSIDDLKGYRFLSAWTRLARPSPERRAAWRKILREAAKALAALGPKPTPNEKRIVLRNCIEKFNRLERESRFIETSERDDILQEFKMLVHVCGLGKEEDMADKWREW